MKSFFALVFFVLFFSSCQKKDTVGTDQNASATNASATNCPTCAFPDTAWTASASGPKLIFKFQVDSMQTRLNNLGTATTLAAENGAQSPKFNGLSAHYIELAQTDLTQLGQGTILYKAEETTCGGANAIVFCKSIVAKNGDVFFTVPLSQVTAGTYKWLRVSLGYQNYDIKVKTTSAGIIDGTIASFVGFNSYVSKYKMHSVVMTPTVNGAGNKLQGYWGFYTSIFNTDFKMEGKAPKTTVVNPNPNSPIPAGSCVVTGEFYKSSTSSLQPLIITGTETQDVIITVSLSSNKSFEWKEVTFDGLFQPEIGETVVDMGIRGLVPKY